MKSFVDLRILVQILFVLVLFDFFSILHLFVDKFLWLVWDSLFYTFTDSSCLKFDEGS